MNYRLNRQGVDLGIFPLEELRRRRQAGELTGIEYVLAEGAPEWQLLDVVLAQTVPPVVSAKPKSIRKWVWIGVAVAACFVLIVGMAAVIIGLRVVKAVRSGQLQPNIVSQSDDSDPVELAGKPVSATNAISVVEVRERAKKFRERQWIEGYEKRGRHDAPCDDEALHFLKVWVAKNYGGDEATNEASPAELGRRLVAQAGCDDPMILAVAGEESDDVHEKIRLLNLALSSFANSKHSGYPKFYAAVLLADASGNQASQYDATALRSFREMLTDGSILPEDQAEIGEILFNTWGARFGSRNRKALADAVPAGKKFEWLKQVLEGEFHIDEAWRHRGSGYANTVTDKGQQDFLRELEQAGVCFEKAFALEPNLPLAPSRMITVSLGDAGIGEMRQWFDRTTAIQVDYARAWSDMRWGLRPRWYGNEAAMIAFANTAVNTGRFDTDVPRMFFDCISDVESEEQLPSGQHIYGREDVWPTMQRLYEGYIAEPAAADSRDGWRSTYAAIAYIAGHYDVARQQLDAVHWKPWERNFDNWGLDLSLMPLEVAARTGPAHREVNLAEDKRAANDLKGALQIYQDLSKTNTDARTGEFIRARLASLDAEQHLQGDGWVDFLPAGEKDPNWVVVSGTVRSSTNGALEVESGSDGHFLYSHTRLATGFEVKGEFEIVQTISKDFQVGLVMGQPDREGRNWLGFRIRRSATQGDFVSYSRGWNKAKSTQPVQLKDGRNSFDFRLENGKATASVNGTEVFRNIAMPAQINVPEGEFMLGLGGHSDKNETSLIRYRNVQVRRL